MRFFANLQKTLSALQKKTRNLCFENLSIKRRLQAYKLDLIKLTFQF